MTRIIAVAVTAMQNVGVVLVGIGSSSVAAAYPTMCPAASAVPPDSRPG